MGRGWGQACLEREQHALFCPFLSLSAAGDKITEPNLLWSWGLSTFTIREFLVASDLSPSLALDPLGRTCLALQNCRSPSSLAYVHLPGTHVLGFLLLTPPTTLNHTHPSTACFRPSITSGICLLTQLPAPLRWLGPGSRTPVNTWLGLRFGTGLWAGCPNTGLGPFGSLLRLGRRLGQGSCQHLTGSSAFATPKLPALQFPRL